MENKELFVQAFQAALIAGDPDRYKHLSENPVHFEHSDATEADWLMRGMDKATQQDYRPVLITGCSCAAIAEIFIKNFL